MNDFDKENRRYFADQEFRRNRHKPDQNMVEYWIPPEKTSNNADGKKSAVSQGNGTHRKITQVTPSTITPTSKRSNGTGGPMKIPKVKEPRENSNSKKSSADHPPNGFQVAYWNIVKYLRKVSEATMGLWQKVQLKRNKMKANRVAPIHTKVQNRHLELEPLCCLSSCLVRGGCTTVVVFEFCYIAITALYILEAVCRKSFTFWQPIPKSFNLSFSHPIFYYIIALYDILLFLMAAATVRALVNFDKNVLRIHFYFCFFSFFINLLLLIFSIWALSATGPLTFTFLNCILIFCFFAQLPLQIWAVTVVQSCRDFFALIHVFVTLAEA